MKYESFLSYITKNIKIIVGENYTVKIHKVIKNNNIELDSLIITGDENNISPSIYLNSYYDEYLNGRPLSEIIYDIYAIYESNYKNINFDFDFFTDFKKVKNRLFYKLVNYNSNKKLLSDIPHIRYLDLAIIFYYGIDSELLGEATIIIHNNHLELWDIDTETLHSIAQNNTQALFPHNIMPMQDIIRELLISQFEQEELLSATHSSISFEAAANDILNQMHSDTDSYMYILTNTARINGAVCILYKDVLKNFSESINSDICILPSSIHEVILLPYNEKVSTDELSHMVKDVNIHGVDASEILSDSVYIYERKKDSVRICSSTSDGN